MDTTTRKHYAIVSLLFLGLAIELLILYPNPVIFVAAVPVGITSIMCCFNRII
jgi:NADH:ubiquinone oxidoreductase subunit 3 (subunit A)